MRLAVSLLVAFLLVGCAAEDPTTSRLKLGQEAFVATENSKDVTTYQPVGGTYDRANDFLMLKSGTKVRIVSDVAGSTGEGHRYTTVYVLEGEGKGATRDVYRHHLIPSP